MTDSFSKRIAQSAKAKKSRIIVALDPPAGRRGLQKFAEKTITAVQEHACAIKINFHLLLPLSAEEISGINKLAHSCGLQSIADIKLNDIENTNEVAVDHLAAMGFDAVIANPFIGRDALAALVKKAHSEGMGAIALVYMSHPGAAEGFGLDAAGGKLYKEFLDRASRAGADGVVVGATQVEILKEVSKSGMPIYSPGVGAQGGDVEQAIRNGSDYLIIGRSIVESDNPAKAVQQIKARISSVRK
jgi:orotidine-5'-phosphate decarboxylase